MFRVCIICFEVKSRRVYDIFSLQSPTRVESLRVVAICCLNLPLILEVLHVPIELRIRKRFHLVLNLKSILLSQEWRYLGREYFFLVEDFVRISLVDVFELCSVDILHLQVIKISEVYFILI